jgi:hypothetical protein
MCGRKEGASKPRLARPVRCRVIKHLDGVVQRRNLDCAASFDRDVEVRWCSQDLAPAALLLLFASHGKCFLVPSLRRRGCGPLLW